MERVTRAPEPTPERLCQLAAMDGGRTPKTKTLTVAMSVSGRNIFGLLAQSEPFDHVAVLVRVRALQVIEQLATLADHFQQPAA
jgi:hypothetical protein